MAETEKRPNTEPQGVPEALDRFFGKLIQFSTISIKKQSNIEDFFMLPRTR